MVKDAERSELSRITFVFETICTADCKLYFLAVRMVSQHFCSMTPSGCIMCTWINEWMCFCFCRDIISGTTMWWSVGMAETTSSHTPTWSRATAPSASPGRLSEQMARWDTDTHATYSGWFISFLANSYFSFKSKFFPESLFRPGVSNSFYIEIHTVGNFILSWVDQWNYSTAW